MYACIWSQLKYNILHSRRLMQFAFISILIFDGKLLRPHSFDPRIIKINVNPMPSQHWLQFIIPNRVWKCANTSLRIIEDIHIVESKDDDDDYYISCNPFLLLEAHFVPAIWVWKSKAKSFNRFNSCYCCRCSTPILIPITAWKIRRYALQTA